MSGKKYVINEGDKFGHFTVMYELPVRISPGGRHERMIKCKCVCGVERDVYMWNLIKRKDHVSCGCKAVLGMNFYKHGLSNHPLYSRYQGMMKRCYDIKSEFYEDYGGRGISVCEEWRNDFMAFYNWAIQNGYHKSLDLDRYPNNDGNYEPNNCRFATEKENCNNRRNSILFDYNEQKLSLPQIARLENIPYGALYDRVKNRNISIDDAVILGKNGERKIRDCPNSMSNKCRELGIRFETVYNRMRYRKISFEESLKTYIK